MRTKIHHRVKRFKQTPYACGPFALAQILNYCGLQITPKEVRDLNGLIPNLGTYDGNLGTTAIELGLKVRLYPQNLYVFDPTWFELPSSKLLRKLSSAKKYAKNKHLRACIDGYIDFIKAGGEIVFTDISRELLLKLLRTRPIIAGLCSTYLYGDRKYNSTTSKYSDTNGTRLGHFVVINGYDPKTDKFTLTDPYYRIPFSSTGRYAVKADRLITSIFLGESTYDCTLIEIF